MVKVDIMEREVAALDEAFKTAKVSVPVASVLLVFRNKIVIAWQTEQALKKKQVVKKEVVKKKVARKK